MNILDLTDVNEINLNTSNYLWYSQCENELKLIKRLNTICSELHKQNYNKLLSNVEHTIFNKQLEYMFNWIKNII